MTTNKLVKLRQEAKDTTCGDGCCWEWWEELYVDDVEVYANEDIDVHAVIRVLNYLGYDVSIEDKVFKAEDFNV